MSILDLLKSKPNNQIKPVVLLVIDGFGTAPDSSGNAINMARKPNIDRMKKEFPYGHLIASGESVGLPANEEGNSEVGHLTMGTGRPVLQSLPRIGSSIRKKTFFNNRALVDAIAHITKYQSKLHIAGLASSGEVHASTHHLAALIEWCRINGLKDVRFHLFTDGRDAPPNDGIKVIKDIEERLKALGLGNIVTLAGRYWAMDRDKRWERIARVYQAMVEGIGTGKFSASQTLEESYANNITDEFVEPTVITPTANQNEESGQQTVTTTIADNDAIIFYNFRVDRARQLAFAFTMDILKEDERDDWKSKEAGKQAEIHAAGWDIIEKGTRRKNLFVATMTQFHKELPVNAVMFPPEKITDTVAEVIAKAGLKQFRLAESEKERMVFFYFDGLKEEAYEGEEVKIVPSSRVATYDKKPQMSVKKIVKTFKHVISEGIYHFILINIANPDMVAHSGNLKATIKAVEHVDRAVKEIANTVLTHDGTLLITADHGNAEELLSLPTASFFYTSEAGAVNTEHSSNPVPIMIIGARWQGSGINIRQGTLSDIGPTVLALLGLPIPQVMTGKPLIKLT